jgi:uncharacterized protein VirK/YbjX
VIFSDHTDRRLEARATGFGIIEALKLVLHHFWFRIKGSSIADVTAVTFSIVRHARLLKPLLLSMPGSRQNDLLRARPEVLEMVHGRYLAANWGAKEKISTVLSHLETVAEIGGVVDFPPDVVVDLIPLDSVGPEYRITLDQPRWLLREGQLALSLWEGIDRIFSLSFSLSTVNGKRVAYIGGIQGRVQAADEPDILERYRIFTKAAFGSRPRDFLVETFRLLCQALGVSEILTVSDANQPLREHQTHLVLSYDDVWKERGGVDNGGGFYILPVASSRRSDEEIPAKKRNVYRKRYALYSEVEERIAGRLRDNSDELLFGSTPKLRDVHGRVGSTTFDRTLRTFAYLAGLFVLSVSKFFGGSWAGFALGLLMLQAVYWLLGAIHSNRVTRRIDALLSVAGWPFVVRLVLGVCLSLAVIWIDVYSGGFAVGRAFNVYLVPVLLTSVLLGRGVAVTVFVISLLALYYLDIPPRFSFEFQSAENVVQIVVFALLAALIFVVPKLLLASIELRKARQATSTKR